MLRVLSRKALLEEFGTRQHQRWRMHDLIHDHARSAYSPQFRSRYADGLPATLKKAHMEWLERCWRGGAWSDCAALRYVDRNLAWHAQMAHRPNIVHALMREQQEGKPSWLHRLIESRNTAQFTADAQRAMELAHLGLQSENRTPVENYVDLIWAAVARASRVSKAKKSSPPLLARLVSEGVVSLHDGLAQIRMQDDLTRAWSFGWLLPHLEKDERARVENELFDILTSILRLVPETSALDAVAPNASTALRRRLIKFAASASAQVHAVILEHLLPWEPQLERASLVEFERRRWRSKAEQRSAYTRLLEVGLKPPGLTPSLLIALAEEPGNDRLNYLACALGYLPDHFVGLWLDALQRSGPNYLLWLVQQQRIPLSDFLLNEIRRRATGAFEPLIRASLMAATARCLPPEERAATEEQAVAQLCAIEKSDWRLPLQMFLASKSLPLGTREYLQVEAWLRARDIGFDQFGVSQFADLVESLTPGAALKVAELIRAGSAQTRIRCLPHLIAGSPSSMTRQLTELLAKTTLEHGGYADLKPCIKVIPSDLLPSLLEAAVALGPRAVQLGRLNGERFALTQPSWSPTDLSWPVMFQWATQPGSSSNALSNKAEKLSADVEALSPPQMLVFFSEALVNTALLDREKLCDLIEAIAIPLARCFDQSELETLRAATEQACSLYA